MDMVAAPGAGEPVAGGLDASTGSQAQVDAQIRQLRAACYAAVRDLAAARPDLLVVVGGGSVTATYPGSAAGSLHEFGIPFTTGTGEPVLPLSLTVGSWLVRHCLNRGAEHPAGRADRADRGSAEPAAVVAGARQPVQPGLSDRVDGEPAEPAAVVAGARQAVPPGRADRADTESAEPLLAGRGPGRPVPRCRTELQEVARSWSAAECETLGARLAVAAPRVALLVMGDGSARKALGVRGAADPAAERYDAQVADALATGNVAGLTGLDPSIAEQCLVSGWPGLQVLAGAAAGRRIRGQLRYAAAPLAVSYFVALWLLD